MPKFRPALRVSRFYSVMKNALALGTRRRLLGTRRLLLGARRLVLDTRRRPLGPRRLVLGPRRPVLDTRRLVLTAFRTSHFRSRFALAALLCAPVCSCPYILYS